MIFSTCGCSLIRLGISKEQAVHYDYQSVSHYFFCRGCKTLFEKAPEMHLRETLDTIVCPTCLSEKPTAYSVSFKFNEEELHFFRCPYCLDAFNKNPEYYLDRLARKTDFKGFFAGDEGAYFH